MPGRVALLSLVLGALALAVGFSCATRPMLKTADILAWSATPSDASIAYGSDPLQVGELRLPTTPGPRPVAVVLHGGCWQSEYDRTYTGRMSTALAQAGFAVWTPEYRRLGDAGGGWPGTFLDVADAIEKLRELAAPHSLDLSRVVLIGHSAGGQLALWYAGTPRLPATSPLHRTNPLSIRGVVALAAVSDLTAHDTACGDSGLELVGGVAISAAHLREASPLAMVPLGVSTISLHGTRDIVVPPALSQTFVTASAKSGDHARLVVCPDAGHFELIDPASPAWPTVLAAVRELAGP